MFNISVLQEPESLESAVELLHAHSGLRIIAGGTDVLIRLQHGGEGWSELLSLRNIKELEGVSLRADGTIVIGATTPFAKLFLDPIIRQHLPSLAEAAVSMGGPQIRNVATIGGNICNGAVSGDSASTLFALDALLKLNRLGSERIIPIHEFYAGPGKVHLQPGEMLTAVLVPRDSYQDTGGHYIKFAMRKAMDIATLGVSVICRVRDGAFQDLRIGLGVAAPVPIRCAEAEAYARGRQVTAECCREIGKLAVKASKARTSWRASKDYREHLIEVLTERAVLEAAQRAGGPKC
ncbi:MAG: xanthine dehydrogenase FAD-binding subunit XdhB [Holophaga sp.]|nr:xanthine dehydrogenase FAD-binding subunit XdhB [Holophaga sp.]